MHKSCILLSAVRQCNWKAEQVCKYTNHSSMSWKKIHHLVSHCPFSGPSEPHEQLLSYESKCSVTAKALWIKGRYKWWRIHAYKDSQASSASLHDEVQIDHAVFLSSHVLCLIASQSWLWLSINSKRGWEKKRNEATPIPFQSIEILMFRNRMNFIVINVQFF